MREPGAVPAAGRLVAAAWEAFAVLFVGWSAFTLLFVYWCENVIVGVFNVARMALAGGLDGGRLGVAGRIVEKILAIPFFVFHYGVFTFAHGALIVGFFGPKPNPHTVDYLRETAWSAATSPVVLVAVGLLAIVHGISFAVDYVAGGGYRDAEVRDLFGAPYRRVLFLHVVILGGAFLVMALPRVFAVAIVGLKLWMDLGVAEKWTAWARARLRGDDGAPPPTGLPRAAPLPPPRAGAGSARRDPSP